MKIMHKIENYNPKTVVNNKKYYIFSIVLILSLVILEIWLNNVMASLGEKFDTIYKLQKQLSLENQVLEIEIAKQVSITNIATKAAELGFSAPQAVQYLK